MKNILMAALILAMSPFSWAYEDKQLHCQQERQRLGIILKATSVDESRIETELLEDGRLRISVDHELVRGVTSEQMDWWFRNMANSIPSGITDCKPYVLLDSDHVDIKGTDTNERGELQLNSRIEFEENLETNGKSYSVKENFLIAKINPGELTFVKDRMFGIPLGVTLVSIERTYTQEDGGVRIRSVFTAGIEGFPKFINSFLIGRFFAKDRQEAWKEHTIAEIGAIESLLPWLIENWIIVSLN